MSIPILATKLYSPPPRPNAVRRPRLLKQLQQGRHNRLTLISAPAGFGKTTLLGQWLSSEDSPAAWLSLDEADNTPVRFLTYLIAALQTIAPQLGEQTLRRLQATPTPPIDTTLTDLLNDIAALPQAVILVLDDYHLIDTPAVDEVLRFLVAHLPPQLHLVIASREDPQLPLARLRVRHQLTELRAADLRFSEAEAADFLNQAMHLDLSAADVAALETRTEGWIAGLQLAALSLQGREDGHSFIQAFAGDHRYIVDYLVEEVLQRQPPAVQSFLRQTAILNQLQASLCDAVTEQSNGAQVLDMLERGNLFLVPLDDQRRWFRYHHLFADVLRAHLQQQQPDLLPILHRRASHWYESRESPFEAIQHALAATDLERAATLMEQTWFAIEENRRYAVWLNWMALLPEALIRRRPVLSLGYAWALFDHGDFEAGESWLQATEQNAAANDVQLRSRIVSARTYHAQARGDTAAALTYAQQALDLLPPDAHEQRAAPASMLGLLAWAQGDLKAADQYLSTTMNSFARSGKILAAITGTYVQAHIRLDQGRLRAAADVCRHALHLAADQTGPAIRGTADIHTALSLIASEHNDPATAARHLAQSQTLSEQANLPRWRHRWCLAQATLARIQGDFASALRWLDEAGRHYVRGPVPETQPLPALKAQIRITQGQLRDVETWLETEHLSATDELSYLREFEHRTLARFLLARQHLDTAHSLLIRLIQAAAAGGRSGSLIDMLILQALAYAAQDDLPAALRPLERALTLAEPEGYIRIFVNEGPAMTDLLKAAAGQDIHPAYVKRLLAAFDAPTPTPPAAAATSLPAPQPLIEPLSDRELEVLQLIAAGLSNRQISERLFLALSTVKGHNRNIFDKLHVKRRTEAVARARELGLLES